VNAPRFWSHVEQAGACLLWIGNLNDLGNGRVRVGGRLLKARRVAYELTYGPIPPGAYVHCSCGHPSCVRPDHLFLGRSASVPRKSRGSSLVA
jgi:hypothetical protein